MSIFDWSDPEEMVGLLADYVADELQEETVDRDRARFLRRLASSLTGLAADAAEVSTHTALEQLRTILDSQPPEFADDPALRHVRDCIDELERIFNQST